MLFLSTHLAPGLTREEMDQNASEVAQCKYAQFVHLYVNMREGFIATVYEATDQKQLEREFERLGFVWDEMHEIHASLDFDALKASVH